jgi:hypothetical protein
MSRASFSTCSTSRLDTSGIDRYSDKDFNELHTYEISDSNITPYKKQLYEKEHNHLTANLSSSIEKWENIPKSTLNEYDGNGRLIDDNSELLGCRKEEHSSARSSGGGDEVEQVRENIMQYSSVNDNNTSNNYVNNHDKIDYDNDNSEDKKDKNRIYDRRKEDYRNANNDKTNNTNENVKSLMNVNRKIPENDFILTDFTANGIIRPVYIGENDNIIDVDSIDTKMKIDGIIIGDYYDSKDDHDNNNYRNDNDNDNNYSNNFDNNCDKNTLNYGNTNNINDYDNVNDNKSDINDDDDDENGWTSMPSSHDLTTTLETIIQKEKKEKNESNENNQNTTSKVSKEKKPEKIRNKKNTPQNEKKNENDENKNEKNRSKKIIKKNINIDERTYDLYSDGTHSKILAYRFERVLLVETFKENAGN